jgi:hypothetical protein
LLSATFPVTDREATPAPVNDDVVVVFVAHGAMPVTVSGGCCFFVNVVDSEEEGDDVDAQGATPVTVSGGCDDADDAQGAFPLPGG